MFNFSSLRNLFRNDINIMTIEDILYDEIQEFNASDKRAWMVIGDRYYRCENDIYKRKMIRHTENGAVEDKSKANNKLAHGFLKNLVDEK